MPDLEPITREEMLLDGQDLEPITRKEMFIKRIYDKTQVIPEPITREEMFLKKAGDETTDVTIEQLNVSENGTYSEEGVAYSPVIVNVPAPPIPDNAYLLNEVEGLPKDIVTFNDGSNLPMPSLKVGIEPQQDLHGYDSPWVGGSGKNKCPKNSGSITVGDFVTFDTPLPSGTYSFSLKATRTPSSNSYATLVPYDIDGNAYSNIVEISANRLDGNVVKAEAREFNNGISKIYVYSIAGNWSDSRNYTLSISDLQIEQGSTATAFQPYSNICPISGHTEANVNVCGKNLFDKTQSFVKDKYIDINGDIQPTSYGWEISDYIPLKNNTNYYISGNNVTGASACNALYDKDKNLVRVFNYPTGEHNGTFSTNANEYYIRICTQESVVNNVQIELGTTPTAYEPYNGQTYTIDLDGTRYGGTLDVVSGVLTLTHGYIASYNDETLPSTWISDRDVYAEGTTPTIGAEVVYELATPLTIQLTPTQVNSLLGSNNVWADCGEILEGQYFSKEE